jgi:hypothetical protein
VLNILENGDYTTAYCTGYWSAENTLTFTYACEGYVPSYYVTSNNIRIELTDIHNAGGSVELDTTLSESGKAADAKAVGDAIGDVESALDRIVEIQNSLIGGEQA